MPMGRVLPSEMFVRRLLKLTTAVTIAIAGLLLFAQTPTGFQRLIIPILAMNDLGSLEAAHGELDLRGRLLLKQARYSNEDLGIEATLASGTLALDIFSLFGSAPVAIENLEVDTADVTIRDTPADDDVADMDVPLGASIEAIAEQTALTLPFTLNHGSVENFTYRQIGEQGASTIIADSLLLENLGAEQSATLQGQLRWQNPNSDQTQTTVNMVIDAALELDEKSAPQSWRLQANADQSTPRDSNDPLTGTLALEIDGNHPDQDNLDAHLRLKGQIGGKTFGKANADIAFSGLRGPSLLQSLGIEITANVQDLIVASLLSFLPPDPARPAIGGELNGAISASGQLKGPLQISSDLTIEDLRIEGSPVPARELKIGFQTTSNLEQNGDFLEIADLKIHLGDGSLIAHGEATPSESSFSIKVQARDFPISSVLAFGGLDTAAEFGALPLNGKLDITRDKDGATQLNNDTRLAVMLGGNKTPEIFHLKGSVNSPAQGPLEAKIHASQPEQSGSISMQATLDKTTDVAVEITDMDLTALVQPFLEARPVHAQATAPAEKIPLPETASQQGDEESSEPSSPLKFRLQVDRSRYREVRIGAMSAKADITDDETHVQIDASEFSKGDLAFTLDMSNSGPVRLAWKGHGERIRLNPLMEAFAGSTTVGGRLKFTTHGRSEVRAPKPAVNGLDGAVVIHLRDGKLQGFEALDMLAKATGVNVLGAFAFSKLDGDIQIQNGKAQVKELQAGGAVGNIHVVGNVDLKGKGAVDLRVNPRVGPSVAGLVKGFKPLNAVLNTAEGLLSLPINIVITGPLAAPKYAVHSQSATEAVSTRGGKLVGGLLNELTLGGSSKLLGALMPSGSEDDSAASPEPAVEK